MEIEPIEFKITVNREEINILHKALSILREDITASGGYSKGYLVKVKKILEETGVWW